jgi:hypothetical protein
MTQKPNANLLNGMASDPHEHGKRIPNPAERYEDLHRGTRVREKTSTNTRTRYTNQTSMTVVTVN